MRPVSRQLLLLVLGSVLIIAGGAGNAGADQRADRRTSERLAAMLPEPPEEWSVVRTEKVWRRGGARVRRIYRGPEGRGVRIVMETRTRGVMYKHDLLNDAERAQQYGYSVIRITDGPAESAASDEASSSGVQGQTQAETENRAEAGQATAVEASDTADTNPAGGVDALIKAAGSETEIRFWLENRILVLVVGQASRAELESLIAGLDFERLARVE